MAFGWLVNQLSNNSVIKYSQDFVFAIGLNVVGTLLFGATAMICKYTYVYIIICTSI